jgi:hypothetical protein
MAHPAVPSPMAETLRYYILREPGSIIVPLVPADQIPVQLPGVPRQLSHRQMVEGGWKFVADTTEPAVMLPTLLSRSNISRPSLPSPLVPRFVAPDHGVRAGESQSPADLRKQFMSHPPAGPLSAPARLHSVSPAPEVSAPSSDAVLGRPRVSTLGVYDAPC